MKHIRLTIVCVSLIVFASYCIAAQTPKVMLYYNFEETGDTITDKSGSGNDGTLFNGAKRVDDGKFGKGIQFDGVDDYAKLPTKDVIEEPGAGTVALWVQAISTQGGGGFPVIFHHDCNMITFGIKNGNWIKSNKHHQRMGRTGNVHRNYQCSNFEVQRRKRSDCWFKYNHRYFRYSIF